MGAVRRSASHSPENDGAAPAPRPASNTGSVAEVVWVHEGPVCVRIVDEPRRGIHDHSCQCAGCQASRLPDPAEYFLPDIDNGG